MFDTIAALLGAKRAIVLYEFQLIGGQAFRYTTFESDIDFGGETYTALNSLGLSIVKGALSMTARIGRADFRIACSAGQPFSSLVADGANVNMRTRVRVLSGFAEDPDADFKVMFDGRVKFHQPVLGEIVLVCENYFTVIRERAIAGLFARPCTARLYGYGCEVAEGPHTHVGTATAWDGIWLTVTEASGFADQWFARGFVEYNGVRVQVTEHVGDRVRPLMRLPGLADEIATLGTASVNLLDGCDRRMKTCSEKFANSDQHRGFPEAFDNPADGRTLG